MCSCNHSSTAPNTKSVLSMIMFFLCLCTLASEVQYNNLNSTFIVRIGYCVGPKQRRNDQAEHLQTEITAAWSEQP